MASPQSGEGPEQKTSVLPEYQGLLRFIEKSGVWEVFLTIVCFVWALICAQWVLALCLFGFFFLNFFRLALIAIRYSFSRWLAVFNYGLMCGYLFHRIDQASGIIITDSSASVVLFKFLFGWFGVMLVLNLGFFTYAKRMSEAPSKPRSKPEGVPSAR